MQRNGVNEELCQNFTHFCIGVTNIMQGVNQPCDKCPAATGGEPSILLTRRVEWGAYFRHKGPCNAHATERNLGCPLQAGHQVSQEQ
jgi:hypothetical protein